jgi:hydroxyacylglutathione hydrolase
MQTAQIIRIPILPFGMVNAHLIIQGGSCVLVDTGLPGSERKVERVLARHGLGLRDLRLIVVTHAHVDHAGSAARLRELSGAPILAHRDDAEFYSRRAQMEFCPTGWFGRLFLRTRLMYEPYAGFEPDILLGGKETLDLAAFGVRGLVRHTAGHTAGSIAVELPSQDALVGDLLASGILLGGIVRTGRARRPPFEDDPQTVARELEQMVQQGARRFYMGHGGPLDAAEVLRHARAIRSIAACRCGHE